METKKKKYAIIHFENKKSIKKNYETCTRAFHDYEDQGCVFVELLNSNGMRLASFPNKK